MLMRAADLEAVMSGQKNGGDLVLVDCRTFKEYSAGHLPGAVNLDLFAFHWFDTTRGGIEEFGRQARRLFSFIGADRSKKVVFYDDVSGMLAARGVWMLTYLSHPDVSMLDGGIRFWKAGGLPTETRPNGFSPSGFSGDADPGVISGFERIVDSAGGSTLIDARSRGEYDGTVIRAARGGHIPGAVNIDWNLNLAPDGTLKDDPALEELYGEIPKDAGVVTYCHGAYRAAHTFVALKKIGFTDVRVYLGSWGEWGNLPQLPADR